VADRASAAVGGGREAESGLLLALARQRQATTAEHAIRSAQRVEFDEYRRRRRIRLAVGVQIDDVLARQYATQDDALAVLAHFDTLLLVIELAEIVVFEMNEVGSGTVVVDDSSGRAPHPHVDVVLARSWPAHLNGVNACRLDRRLRARLDEHGQLDEREHEQHESCQKINDKNGGHRSH